MITTIAKLGASALLALILAGCGGAAALPTPAARVGSGNPAGTGNPAGSIPAPASRPAGSIDSCALLTDQEIEAATDRVVDDRKPSMLTRLFPSVCDIELKAGGELTIGIMPSGGRSVYEDSIEPFIGKVNMPLYDEAVEGLGDKAAIGDGAVTVLKEDILFDISWPPPGISDKQAVLRYLAAVILAKLPCLAVGCPGFTPPPPPPVAEEFDACSLLTGEEIEDATGFRAIESLPVLRLGGVRGCAWSLDGESVTDSIKVWLMESGGRERFDFLTGAFEVPLEHLPGLGDDALKTGTIPAGSIYAVVGDRLLELQFDLGHADDDDDPYYAYALVVPLVEVALLRLR